MRGKEHFLSGFRMAWVRHLTTKWRTKVATKSTKSTEEDQTQPRPGDFPLGSPASRAAARALMEAREKSKLVVELTNYSWEPDHPRVLHSSGVREDGQQWEVWKVAYSPSTPAPTE